MTAELRIQTDRVLFIMPQDPELQVVAMSAVQAWVNSYQERAKAFDVAGVRCTRCKAKRTVPASCAVCSCTQAEPIAIYELQYVVSGISQRDWDLYMSLGLALTVEPLVRLYPSVPTADDAFTMVVDLSDSRLLSLSSSGKHACQICAVLAGVGVSPLPGLKQVLPRRTVDFVWAALGTFEAAWVPAMPMLHEQDLVGLASGMYTGFIGYASRATYLASAMGFPVVEVVPAGRPRQWLSKFTNTGYRVVSDSRGVYTAMASIEGIIRDAL